MSYLCSQRASREAAEEPTTCAHVPAGKEPAVRKNAFVIGERAATIRGRVCGSGGEEICEALPDSIHKDKRERRPGHTEAVGHCVVACRKGPNEWKRLDSIGMRDAEDGRQREHFA